MLKFEEERRLRCVVHTCACGLRRIY